MAIGGDADRQVNVNSYFADHPERVIGATGIRSGQFGPELEVKAAGDVDVALELRTRLDAELARAAGDDPAWTLFGPRTATTGRPPGAAGRCPGRAPGPPHRRGRRRPVQRRHRRPARRAPGPGQPGPRTHRPARAARHHRGAAGRRGSHGRGLRAHRRTTAPAQHPLRRLRQTVGADQPDHLPPHRPRRRGHRRRPPRPHRPAPRRASNSTRTPPPSTRWKTSTPPPAPPARPRSCPGAWSPPAPRAWARTPRPTPSRSAWTPTARSTSTRSPGCSAAARTDTRHALTGLVFADPVRRQQHRAVDPGAGVPVRQRAHQARRTPRPPPNATPPPPTAAAAGTQHRRPAAGHPDRSHPGRDRRPARRVLDRAPTTCSSSCARSSKTPT